MGFHLINGPTMGQFIEHAKGQGISLVSTQRKLQCPDEKKHQIKYFQRLIDDGPALTYPLPTENLNQKLSFTILRAMCNALQISPKSFGVII